MTDARSPKTISGLVGWYTGLSAEVTSGSVSSWKDISGQGNHATTIQGSPKVDSVGVTASQTPGSPAVAFHYGNFDNHYGDGTRANAAKAGRIYADTLSAEIPPEFGILVSASTASGQTTYTWFQTYSVIADVLVVAGGGGGGSGGGGAGGVVYKTGETLNSASYTIKVGQGGVGGGGGAGGAGQIGVPENGYNSTFSTDTAVGGGAGGGYGTSSSGDDGGSGGGSRFDQPSVTPSSGTPGQGFGGGISTRSAYGGAGGGGGAGGAGSNATEQTSVIGRGGVGGGGLLMSVFGETYGENGYFAGGGGGGANTNSTSATGGGTGGVGGGGQGAFANLGIGSPGRAHTGGGGGGGDPEGTGAAGGSGIVLLLFRDAQGRGSTQFPFLYGGTGDGLRFPTAVMSADSPNYTLFHVARYYKPTGVPTRGRIFDGLGNIWLSGFHDNKAGVAYHVGGWITPQSDLHGNQWVLSTDQRNMYRSNGTDRTTATYTGSESTTLTINDGNAVASESSDWAVAEVIVFNRELTSAEYLSMEAYLSAKYFDSGVVPATGVISGSLLNAIFYTGADGVGGSTGYPISISRLGRRIGTTLGTILRASDFRLPGYLDSITSIPSAAYSLRKLFYSYGGPQVRVRRSSDNVEASIYMNEDGDVIHIEGSTGTNLTTWLGGGTAYVKTWYDQSGNGNHMYSNQEPVLEYDTVQNYYTVNTSGLNTLRPMVSSSYTNLRIGDGAYSVVATFKLNSVDANTMLFSMGPANSVCSAQSIHPISIGGGTKFAGGACGATGTWSSASGVTPTVDSYTNMITTFSGGVDGTENVYINNSLDKSATQSTNTPDSSANRIGLGWIRDDGAGRTTNAKIFTLLFYPYTELNSTQRTELNDLL